VCACVGTSGCVDEHFAKSLGSAWNRIKSSLDTQDSASGTDRTGRQHASQQQQQQLETQDSSVTDNSSMSVCDPPGSVDDHFAKALGDTWFRIKAEHEALVADADQS